MSGFCFAKLAIHTGGEKYAACSVPTNLANWGVNTLVGNLTAVNINESEVGFYFTRVNPLQDLGDFPVPDEHGFMELTIAQRNALIAELEAKKVAYVPGSSALLGLTTDWVPFEDLNYVTIVTAGADHDLHAYVQLLEQQLPRVKA